MGPTMKYKNTLFPILMHYNRIKMYGTAESFFRVS